MNILDYFWYDKETILRKKICDLNLNSILYNLRDKHGWDMVKAVNAGIEYKQFLYIIGTNPKQAVVPWDQNLDDFWHQHILDTRKYAEDCQNLFGRIIHHDPNTTRNISSHELSWRGTILLYKGFVDNVLSKEHRPFTDTWLSQKAKFFDDAYAKYYRTKITKSVISSSSSRTARTNYTSSQNTSTPICGTACSVSHSSPIPSHSNDFGGGDFGGGGAGGSYDGGSHSSCSSSSSSCGSGCSGGGD